MYHQKAIRNFLQRLCHHSLKEIVLKISVISWDEVGSIDCRRAEGPFVFLAALDLSWGMRDLWCARSSLWRTGFSLVVACGFSLSSCGAWAPECVGSVVCGTRALSLRCAGSVVVARGLSCSVACGNLSSLTRDWTRVPCIGRQILYHWTTREVPRGTFGVMGMFSGQRMVIWVYTFVRTYQTVKMGIFYYL